MRFSLSARNLSKNIMSLTHTGRPLVLILICAALIRIVAAVCSKGYAMYDDHFCVVEIAQRWLDGYHDWLGDRTSIRSVVYPGLHYAAFRMCEAAGVFDPQIKMLAVRLAHAFYSLLTVVFGYLLAKRISDQDGARQAGWLLALFWLFPFLSVRNLIEFVCVPPLMAGTWLLYREPKNGTDAVTAGAGACFGAAFTLRFQTAIFLPATACILMLRRQWRQAFFFCAGWCITALCMQGISDWFAYGRPFSSVIGYIGYNIGSARDYVVGPWYQYIALLAAVFIPPISLCILYGWLRLWRRHALLFWPSFSYLLFHSLFPGKQERFILPVVPLILVAGLAGWNMSGLRGRLTRAHPKAVKAMWLWLWAVNTALLLICSTTYVKKTRCETLSRIWRYHDARAVVVEGTDDKMTKPPRFYLGTDIPFFIMTEKSPADSLAAAIRSAGVMPNYLIMIGDENIDKRKKIILSMTRTLEFDSTVRPGMLDAFLQMINPAYNKNYKSHIYKITW